MLNTTSNDHDRDTPPMIYLDNAATTALDPLVLEAMLPFLSRQYGNSSSIHRYGREAKIAVERSRRTIADLLGAEPRQLLFTASGTEANNTAIAAVSQELTCRTIISSPVEHHAVLHTVEHYAQRYHMLLKLLPLREHGHVDLGALEDELKKGRMTKFVSLMYANNEMGNITDIKRVREICTGYPVILHTDAVQAVGHYKVDVRELGVDFLSASAHKFHGPKGVGLLYAREPATLPPFIHGGGQERGKRAGTENVAGIVGMAAALSLAMERLETDRIHIQSVKTGVIRYLRERIPAAGYFGDAEGESLYTVLNIALPVKDQEADPVLALDLQGVCVSGGSACHGGAASHVISAMGNSKDYTPVRLSFSKYTTVEEGLRALDLLAEIGS